MKKSARRLTTTGLTAFASLVLAGCDPQQVVVTSVNTMCTSTTRYHATEAQAKAFKADPGLWSPLVDWLFGFDKVRDKECLSPTTP